MDRPQQIPWLRITAEGVAIVVSILLAFSIEAWWQARNEAAEERELLQALLDDFQATKEEIQNWRAFHLAVEESTKALVVATTYRNPSEIPPDLRKLITNITWFDNESHFTTGALNSIVNGGDLPRIQNSRLAKDCRRLADANQKCGNHSKAGLRVFPERIDAFLARKHLVAVVGRWQYTETRGSGCRVSQCNDRVFGFIRTAGPATC